MPLHFPNDHADQAARDFPAPRPMIRGVSLPPDVLAVTCDADEAGDGRCREMLAVASKIARAVGTDASVRTDTVTLSVTLVGDSVVGVAVTNGSPFTKSARRWSRKLARRV